MKEFEPVKIAVLSFIFIVLTFMFLFAVFGEFSEAAYADTVRSAQAFVGNPVPSVVDNYGEPEGIQYDSEKNDSACGNAYWYYKNVIFYIHYDGSLNAEGIVVDVEVVR